MNGITGLFAKDHVLKQKPPLDAGYIAQQAGVYDAWWAANHYAMYAPDAFDLLVAQHPKQLRLCYTTAVRAKPGDPGTFPVEWIDKHHPDWWLVQSKGLKPEDPANRIPWSDKEKDGWLLDIGNPDFQWMAAEWLKAFVAAGRYDGAALDNCIIGKQRLSQIDRKYPRWKYAEQVGHGYWGIHFLGYLDVIRSSGTRSYINHTLYSGSSAHSTIWTELARRVSGMMSEIPLGPPGNRLTGNEWRRAMDQHQAILDANCRDWWTVYPKAHGKRTAHADFMYHWCSWLLLYREGKSLFHASRFGSNDWENPLMWPWYEEYDEVPSLPETGYQIAGELAWRRFDDSNPLEPSKAVLVNFSKDVPALWAPKGVVIPPQTGVIL